MPVQRPSRSRRAAVAQAADRGPQIVVGSVVTLKSGGAAMTVTAITADGIETAWWTPGHSYLDERIWPHVTLKLAPEVNRPADDSEIPF